MWRVETAECAVAMAAMEPASLDAIVTSPPYADQRDYAKAAAGDMPGGLTYPRTRASSRRQRPDAPSLFVEEFMPALDLMLPLLKPTGSLMLNLGVIMREGEEHPYADEILRRARDSGWKLLHRAIWHKPNAIPLSHPSYLHLKHEWIFWLAPSVGAYRGYDADTRVAHSETSLRRIGQPYMTRKDQRYMRRGKTHGLHPDGARPTTLYEADYDESDLAVARRAQDVVLRAAVGGDSGIAHPAIMALKLALQLVSLSCPPGGVVMDPYCGSGTTGVAALRRGRSFVGIEREAPFAELARERIRDDAPLMNVALEHVA